MNYNPDAPDIIIAFLTAVEFLEIYAVGGAKTQMIMAMILVSVCGKDIGVP